MAGELRLKTTAKALRPHSGGIFWYQHVLETPQNPASTLARKSKNEIRNSAAISSIKFRFSALSVHLCFD
jgi:hypothetical protein